MTTETEIIALHEMAHFVVAGAFGINAMPEVIPTAERYPEAVGSRIVAGQCRFDRVARVTSFQESVIGWAGVITEALLGIQHTLPKMPFPLTKARMRDWFRAAMTNFESLSLGDQLAILKHKSPWTSFKAAYRLVRKNKTKIASLSRLMVEQGKGNMKQPIPEDQDSSALRYRCQLLEKILATVPSDHPDRPQLEKTLATFKLGQWPDSELHEPNH